MYQEFCNRTRNLQSVQEKDNLLLVRSQVPALWKSLAEIIHFEATSEFLPVDIAVIVKKLIKMRIDIVQNAPQRVESDYVLWPDRGQEHATQFYPQREIWRYPKKYLMQNQGIDQDLCQKSFNSSRTFTNGVFR